MSVAAPTPEVSNSSGGDVDMASLGTALWRKKRRILLSTIIVALLTLIVVQTITPRYQSESRVLIESRDNVYLRPDADKITTDLTVDAEAVTSQAQIILSRDLAREVINKLKLGDRPEFDSTLNGVSPLRALLGLIGIGKDPLSMSHEERVLQAYYDRLSVFPVEKSRIINIDFLSEDPELAAQVANAIAEGYLLRQRENKQDQAKSAGDWLAGQIETMRKKVEDAEAKVEDFRAKANLLVGTNNTTLSAQQLGDLNAQLAAARAQKSISTARYGPRRIPSRVRSKMTPSLPAPASTRKSRASICSRTRRRRPTGKTCNCARSNGMRNRSAICLNPIWRNIARRVRTIPSIPPRLTLVSCPARQCPTFRLIRRSCRPF
jgi:succinoglycan biosynthesis transport protein ExoP